MDCYYHGYSGGPGGECTSCEREGGEMSHAHPRRTTYDILDDEPDDECGSDAPRGYENDPRFSAVAATQAEERVMQMLDAVIEASRERLENSIRRGEQELREGRTTSLDDLT